MAKKKPYRFFVYLLARLAAELFSFVPRCVLHFLVRSLSLLLFLILKKQRQLMVKHLSQAFGDRKTPKEINAIARGVILNLGLTAADCLNLNRLTWRRVSEFVDAQNAFSVYDELLSEGRGIISMTAHIGNWELLAGTFGLKGYEGAVLARRIYYERYNAWIVGIRRHMNVRTIYRDQASREILNLLSQNKIIGLLPDQDIDSLKGVFVPFFGKEAYTPVAPARLAISSGAPIVCNFLIREPSGKYKIVIGDIIRAQTGQPRDLEVKRITESWMQAFEKMIAKYPEQWVWMHDRWKTRPEKADKVFNPSVEKVTE